METLAKFWGMLMGAALATFLLSRLTNILYSIIIKNPNIVFIVSCLTVTILCLLVASTKIGAEALIFVPVSILWLIIDLARQRKVPSQPASAIMSSPTTTHTMEGSAKAPSNIESHDETNIAVSNRNIIKVGAAIAVGLITLASLVYLFQALSTNTPKVENINKKVAPIFLETIKKTLREYRLLDSRKQALLSSSECESGYSIKSILNDGKIVIVDDGSIWEVVAHDTVVSSTWLPVDDIVVCYEKLINIDHDNEVDAIKLR